MAQSDLALKLFVAGAVFLFLFVCADLYLVFYGNQIFGWEKSPFEMAMGYLGPLELASWPYDETQAPYDAYTPYYGQSGQSGLDEDSTYFNDAVQSLDPQECLQIKDVNMKDSCLFTVAKVSIKPETCAMVTAVFERDNCYLSLSYDVKKVEVCRKIEMKSQAGYCAFELAKATGNAAFCSEAEPYLSICFQEMARETGNKELCDYIPETGYKRPCLDFFRKKNREPLPECETEAQFLEEKLEYKEEASIRKCYSEKSLEAKDITLCERARDMDHCILRYSDSLTQENSVSECAKLSRREYQEDCYFYSGNCSLISDLESREMCIVNNAYGFTDVNQCNILTIAAEKAACYGIAARENGDDSVCTLLENGSDGTMESGVDTCYSYFADGREDRLATCNKIESEMEKGTCIWQIAMQSRKTEYCEMLPSEGNGLRKEDCYFSLGAISKDAGLCEKVKDEQRKSYCLAMATGDSSYCKQVAQSDMEDCYQDVKDAWGQAG
ncbi:MAG: hypothetical protein V1493_01570 [Candidatus Diapherotrites archaeon]